MTHFAMSYQAIERNEKHVDAISRALKKSKSLYLATDPDREGEAISWHLRELLRERGDLKGKDVKRVVFYEITKGEVQRAVAEPRDLSLDLVNAQQARRALDYLVGFNLSPLLWKKVRRGLSAGRVQSPALRMICEREHEISIFNPQEYWTLEAEGEHSAQTFPLKLVEFDGQKVEQFSFTNETAARAVEQALNDAAQGFLHVASIDRKQRRRNPSPPFTTSTLQQEAARKLGYSAQRTMRLAQQLYEGVDFGEGSIGLITYMRTDSVNLAAEAVREMREVIAKEYGNEAVAEEPRVYKTKSRNAQEAHEAIRPTSASILPSRVEGKIDPDQFKLYALVWKRAVASQMSHALFDTVAVDMLPSKQAEAGSAAAPHRHVLRANGSTLIKPGYMAVYQEDVDDGKSENESDRILPAMKDGDVVTLLNVHGDQHFTEPPPRFSEASLVKALEEHGIGRPSTYATIISTLKDREYVDMDNRRFIPTDIGKIVNGFLSKHFHKYVEYGFTAALEDELDAVSRGEEAWTEPLKKFWKPFVSLVDHVEKNVSREEVAQARELGKDPVSGKPITVRMGRYGPFVQIGTKDDEEKPKFAGLRPGQKMDLIKLPEALELFKLPRKLGAHGRRRARRGEHRPIRAVHQVRRQVCVAQAAGRSVHGGTRTCARSHPPQEGSRRESHHPGLRRRQYPGAERPLWPVHHRWQAQRAHSKGHGSQGNRARPLPRAAGGSAAPRQPLWPQEDGGSGARRPGRGGGRRGNQVCGQGREEIRQQDRSQGRPRPRPRPSRKRNPRLPRRTCRRAPRPSVAHRPRPRAKRRNRRPGGRPRGPAPRLTTGDHAARSMRAMKHPASAWRR